jgi:hypothetical protein
MIFGTKSKNPADMVRKLMTSYGALVRETFKHEGLRGGDGVARGAIGTAADDAMATGDFLGWHSMIHRGVKRPKAVRAAL